MATRNEASWTNFRPPAESAPGTKGQCFLPHPGTAGPTRQARAASVFQRRTVRSNEGRVVHDDDDDADDDDDYDYTDDDGACGNGEGVNDANADEDGAWKVLAAGPRCMSKTCIVRQPFFSGLSSSTSGPPIQVSTGRTEQLSHAPRQRCCLQPRVAAPPFATTSRHTLSSPWAHLPATLRARAERLILLTRAR